jgi:hypothetical protein
MNGGVDAVEAAMRVAAARYLKGDVSPFRDGQHGFGAGRWPRSDRPDAVLFSRELGFDDEGVDGCIGGRVASIQRHGDLVIAIRSLETERPIRVKVYVNAVNRKNVTHTIVQRHRDNPWPVHSFVLPPGGSAQPLGGGRALPLIAMTYQDVVVEAVGNSPAGSHSPAALELVYALVEGAVRRRIGLSYWDAPSVCGPTPFEAMVRAEREKTAARRIQAAFKRAIADPAFALCRRRLEREFESGIV